MRAHVPSYHLVTPTSLPEALSALAREPGVWHPFAGGTDLMVLLESGKLPHKNYLNIWNLAALRGIEVSTEHVTLGALTTYTDVQAHGVLRQEFPMLCQAASETGGLAIQNRGTLGGNIVNASRRRLASRLAGLQRGVGTSLRTRLALDPLPKFSYRLQANHHAA